MRWGLGGLSVEVVVEILSYVSYVDLLRCSVVSRRLTSVIRDTPSLQYTIELGMAGYDNGMASTNITHRLSYIRTQRRAWKHPALKRMKSIPVPSHDWFEARSHKDVISGRIPDDCSRLDVLYLSTSVRDEDRLKQLQFDIRFDAVYIDPGQDLVVLASLALSPDAAGMRPSPRLHLRSLQDQQPHARAKQNLIDLASYGFPAATYVRRVKIQVSGDFLTLTIHKSLAVEAILVWHWPSGTILAVLRSAFEATYLTAFCTADGYLLVNRQYRYSSNGFGINVYALHIDEEVPSLLATFDLPKLKGQPLSSSFFPGYGKYAQLAGPIAAGPTDVNPAQVLIQLRVDPEYTLFTPLSTFLSFTVLEDRRRVSPLRHSWNAWGPRTCRIFEGQTESAIVCGYKAIYPDSILDFCPVRDGTEDDLATTSPTTITKSPIFADAVVTRLPFRKVKLPFSNTLMRDQLQLFFEDTDGPKIVRATCEEFILIPTSVDIYAILPSDEVEVEAHDQ